MKNDHDAMTVVDPARNSTFHVVECDDERLDRLIDSVDRGEEVSLELRRVGRRGNAWCVTGAGGTGAESGRSGTGTGGGTDQRETDGNAPVGGGAESVRSGDGNPSSEGEEADPVVGH
ncbi:hypothetical protein C469_02401 [Halorubrum lipolyticum DSM 21995]|uniref:DUF7999 domain-containing protein n=1 Tax=Halorubrum lipolyticum DSM 21995 TaxID=1227482 RepID=M0P2B1_9EURY|nr:hypothetical protein C469_02401 [Halorubrum lipolyticum DSM 21995]